MSWNCTANLEMVTLQVLGNSRATGQASHWKLKPSWKAIMIVCYQMIRKPPLVCYQYLTIIIYCNMGSMWLINFVLLLVVPSFSIWYSGKWKWVVRYVSGCELYVNFYLFSFVRWDLWSTVRACTHSCGWQGMLNTTHEYFSSGTLKSS